MREMSGTILTIGVCLCLLQPEIAASLSFSWGNLSLFNVNFKTPTILGRSIAMDSNLRVETEVDPNIDEDSHLNTVSPTAEV